MDKQKQDSNKYWENRKWNYSIKKEREMKPKICADPKCGHEESEHPESFKNECIIKDCPCKKFEEEKELRRFITNV